VVNEPVVSFPVRSYRDLIAWQKAIELVTEIYRATQSFPDSERFGLTSQLRRAAVSVPSNIAEGHVRQSTGEFKQFLGHARGSLLEGETQIFIARNLGYFSQERSTNLIKRTEEAGRILNGLIGLLKGR
jgi:four helix bundle protein